MSLYVLDTDILSLLQLNNPQVAKRVLSHSPDELAVTIISVEEQVRGWFTVVRCEESSPHVHLSNSAAAVRRSAVTIEAETQELCHARQQKNSVRIPPNPLRMLEIRRHWLC